MKKTLLLLLMSLTCFQGNAQSCFSNSVPFNFGNATRPIVTGDFNNDGNLDLVVFTDGSSQKGLKIALGNGAGNFATPTAANTVSFNNSNTVGAMAVGHFNSDNNLDVVVMINYNRPEIYFGNGLGGLVQSTSNSAFPTLLGSGLTVGYFNDDNLMDVAISDRFRIIIAYANGTGFSNNIQYINVPVGLSGNINTSKGAIVNADFNNDGHYDFAVSNEDDSSFSVLLNNGSNLFPFADNYTLGGSVSFDRALKVADFNGDGILDILTIKALNGGSGFRGIKVFLGDGTGLFPTVVDTATLQYSDFVVADFDGDSILDLASNMGALMTILKGNGDGSFGITNSFGTSPFADAYFIFNHLVGGDFNNDGRIDIATANYNNNTDGEKVSVFLNRNNNILSTTPNSRCGTGTVVLSATVALGNTVKWYNSPSGGSVLFTGATFTTPSISSTTSYYAEASIASCISTRVEVVATVNPNTTPTFTQVPAICSGATLTALPTTSNNNITGTWSPALNNSATTTYTFTPTSTQCTATVNMTITVNPSVTPTFTQRPAICSGTTLVALPTTSTNGITGTWSPALNNTATTTYTFTPATSQCATPATMSITVNPTVAPTFTQVVPICNGASLAALPLNSTNGITGTWSPALNNSATTTYTFTPGTSQCATATTMTITVSPTVAAPTGNTNQTFCAGETVGNLVVNGTSVIWYNASTLGNVVQNNTPLAAGTTYYASQTISNCSSNTRLAVTVSIGGCLDNEYFEVNNFKFYPNPTKNILNIAYSETIDKVALYNTIGQLITVKTINSKEGELDLSNYPSGSYFIKVIGDNFNKTIQIIKE